MKEENLETITSERNYLWEKCEQLYNQITSNGMVKASVFRQSVGMAGNLFRDKMDMSFANTWFGGVSDFLDWFEKAKEQGMGPSQ
jgi:hypothetical protein